MKNLYLILFVFVAYFGFSQQNIQFENLGKNINSEYSELAPVISPDGRTLYFVREKHPENKCNQAIWFALLQPDSTWGPAQRMGKPFNEENNNSVNSVSADGTMLLLPDAYVRGEYLSKGYSFTHRTTKGWSAFESIGMKDYAEMAKGTFAFANLSADGNRIVMCFSPSGNDADNDLFISILQADKSWSAPISLGSEVNSGYSEITPYLAPDGVTLYFASNRPGGFGKYDVYMSQRLDGSFTRWSPAVNLGAGFNTEKSEAYFTLDAKGEYAYLSSTNNSIGAHDIIRIRLKQEMRPQPVVLIQGKVLGHEGQPVDATIEYEVLPSGTKVGTVQTDPRDGSYRIVLPYGNMYGYTINAENQMPISANIDLTSVNEYREIVSDFALKPIQVGENIRLNNLFFATNSDVLLPASMPELDRLVKILETRKKMEIAINGHTDNVGSSAYNAQLSQRRAETVCMYLISKGIKPERVKAAGYGDTKPVVENNSAENMALNRRVEFTILKK